MEVEEWELKTEREQTWHSFMGLLACACMHGRARKKTLDAGCCVDYSRLIEDFGRNGRWGTRKQNTGDH